MTSFLIVGTDKTKREIAVETLCSEHEIAAIDKTLLQKDSSSKTSTLSIGIEEIKIMQKALFLRPIKSKTKAVIIEDAQLLTPEAQNALLKVLEEPPAHTILILSSETKEVMLPTILSRCKTIMIAEETPKLSTKETQEITSFLRDVFTMTVAERLKKAEQMAKDKEKAALWAGKVLLCERELLMENPNQYKAVELLRAFHSLYKTLKTTNANPRFAIEHTLLSLK